jgi:competence protein ComEA
MVKPLVHTLIVSLLPALVWAGPVDINTADAETLAAELDGIGLARAQAIVEDRQANGPFVGAEDLGRVKGVGQWIVEQNRANIQVDTKR